MTAGLAFVPEFFALLFFFATRERRSRGSGTVIDMGIRKRLGVGAFFSVQKGRYIAGWVLAINDDRSCSMHGWSWSFSKGHTWRRADVALEGREEACLYRSLELDI